MAIFRCLSCDQIFDLSIQHSLEGLNFCGKCYSEHREKIKPKILLNRFDGVFEEEIQPKQRKKKK